MLSRIYPLRLGVGLMLLVWMRACPMVQAAEQENKSGEITVTVDKLDRPPEVLKTEAVEYPFEMKTDRLEGFVLLEFTVTAQGRVRDPFVVSSNNPAFERAALNAIQAWRFKPGIKNGQPVNTARVQLPIQFSINEGGGRYSWRVKKSKEHDELPEEYRWETPPSPINSTFPVYPYDSLLEKIEGKVLVVCVVGLKGEVMKVMIKESTTPELGLAAQAALEAWLFAPAKKKDGSPCRAIVGLEYIFDATGRKNVPVSQSAKHLMVVLEKTPERIVSAKGLDRPIKGLSRRPPVFPVALRTSTPAGQAVVEFFIDEEGDTQLQRVVSATAPEFGYAAVQAIAAWRFESPRKNGKAVITKAQVPVKFTLQDHPPAAK